MNPAADTGARAGPGGWLGRVDAAVVRAVEVIAALLVVVEVLTLLAGVAARYVFQQPLVWTDEVASILFLWLGMLGAVVALRRGEHMRMTALTDRLPARWRPAVEALAVSAAVLFLVVLEWPAWEFASEEAVVATPALEISSAWRAAAVPAGGALMILAALLRLLRPGQRGAAALAVVGTAAIAGALASLSGPLHALGNWNLLLFFVVIVFACVLAGIPIAFCFGLATTGYLALTTEVPLPLVVGRMQEGMSHLILLSVPLFVFLGLLIEVTGMARAMVGFLGALLGHVRGGLHYVLLGSMYLVSGISGSKAADMAAVAPVLFPEMELRGARRGDLVALLSATGAQTETIPPSLVLITIGSVTGVSITALFTGGLLPGLVLAATLGAVVWWRARGEDLSHVRKATRGEVLRAFLTAAPALALPFVIRAAVVQGVATATEVSTIGIAYCLLAGLLLYRGTRWRRVPALLVETASLSGAILLIIGAATSMAWALTQSGFSQDLAQAMTRLPGGSAAFLAVSVAVFIVLGSVLEGIPAIVLFGPLLFPVARQMGVHEVHYAMVVVLAMGIGLFAPPFGVGYYAACAIGRARPAEGMRPILAYLAALVVGVVVVAAVPWISTGFIH